MTKILRVSNEDMGTGIPFSTSTTVDNNVPQVTGHITSGTMTFNLLHNITEIIPLVIKSVCENTSADIVNNSDLGQKMIQSIVVSRLTAKLHPVVKS